MTLTLDEASTLCDLIDRLGLSLSEKEAEVYSRLCLFIFLEQITRALPKPTFKEISPGVYAVMQSWNEKNWKDAEEDERGDFR